MKLRLKSWYGACITLALLWPLAAQCQSKLYLKADVGGNITQDTDLRQFFGTDTTGARVKFDPGFRIGIAAGYDLLDWFAVEGEVGALANNIHSISGADRVDAVFENVPFLVNAKLQGPRSWRIRPYIGAGVGGAASVIDIDHIDRSGVHVDGTAADAVFAYQGFAGLHVALNETMSVGFEYRYFAADRPTWKTDDFTSASGSDRMSFGRARTHAFSAVFEWHF